MTTENADSTHNSLTELREWASHITAETRGSTWIDDGYLMPEEVSNLCRKLATERGGLHALIGYQGVGKTSAMLAIAHELRKSIATNTKQKPNLSKTIFAFKWRQPSELIPELLRREDDVSSKVKAFYTSSLARLLKKRRPDETLIRKTNSGYKEGLRYVTTLEDLASHDFTEAERTLGKALVERLRYESFLDALGEAQTILIDLPDYSRTDMRRATTDLETIHWIWNGLTQTPNQPNIVISFQKELFRGHFFLGKMNRIDLLPFKPETLLKFYEKRFHGTKPFTQEALLLLAKMSRGIFRRFLRYITLTLNHQERAGTPLPITVNHVHDAIPAQLLAQDMDQQLTEIFPRQPDMRTAAVKLLLHLEEHGPTTQPKIKELLDLPDYTVSRLVCKLEDYRYVRREKKGIENIIALETP